MAVKAQAKYVRMSPRKVREVVDLIRGKSVADGHHARQPIRRGSQPHYPAAGHTDRVDPDRLHAVIVQEMARRRAEVVAIDARRRADGSYEVYSHGGRRATGLDAVEWAREVVERGAGEILLTSMDADGTKDGFELVLTAAVAEAVSVPVIASGGAGNAGHMADAVSLGKADAVLAASIFHYGELTINEVKLEMHKRGIPVRLPKVSASS